MMRAIIVLMLIAAPCMAQWPSWSNPMYKSYDRGNQALSGAVERLTVAVGPEAWKDYITTNIWASYFSQASKLKASKAMLKAAVDTGIWTRPATNWTPEAAETVTASNLLAWCGAPAGWWTNHPYVNIAAVSNGWRFLPDVASNMVWTVYDSVFTMPSYSGGIETVYYGTGSTFSAACSDAAATGPWSVTTNTYNYENSIAYNQFEIPGFFQAALFVTRAGWFWEPSGDDVYAPNFGSSLSMWNLQYDDGGASLSFDAQGCNVSTSEWVNVFTEDLSIGQIEGSRFSLIPTNYTTPPTSAPAPALGVGIGWNTSYSTGLDLEWIYLHRFSATTNGFKWFR